MRSRRSASALSAVSPLPLFLSDAGQEYFSRSELPTANWQLICTLKGHCE